MKTIDIINVYDKRYKKLKVGRMLHRQISLIAWGIALILVFIGVISAGLKGNLNPQKLEVKWNVYSIVAGYILLLLIALFNWVYETRPKIREKINKRALSYKKNEKALEKLQKEILEEYSIFDNLNKLLYLKLSFKKEIEDHNDKLNIIISAFFSIIPVVVILINFCTGLTIKYEIIVLIYFFIVSYFSTSLKERIGSKIYRYNKIINVIDKRIECIMEDILDDRK